MVLPWWRRAGESAGDHDLKGSLTFLAGSSGQGFGGPSDMTAGFDVQRSLLSSGTLRFNGNLGYGVAGQGLPAAVLRTTYTSRFNGVFEPSMAITALRLNAPDVNTMPGGSLQALSVKSSDRLVFGDKLEVKLGSELQTIQFLRRVNAFRPFGSADLHITPDTVLEYEYSSSVPHRGLDDRLGSDLPAENHSSENGFDSASSDLSETAPRISITGFMPAVEKAHHQELSLSQRIGKNNIQVAVYSDSITDPVLTGVGEMQRGEMLAESGDVSAGYLLGYIQLSGK